MRLVDADKIREIVNDAITELVKDTDLVVDFVSVLTDEKLYGHLLGVAKISVQLGIAYEFPRKKLVRLAKAGLMHDVGKLFIDRDILYTPRRLTDAEFAVVKQHPMLGFNFMKDKIKTKDKMMLDAIRHHHEKRGGFGYPDGMEKSTLINEIITVADIFSALTEARVYKLPMSVHKALDILKSDKGVNQEIVAKLEQLTVDDVSMYLYAKKYAKWFRTKYPQLDRFALWRRRRK